MNTKKSNNKFRNTVFYVVLFFYFLGPVAFFIAKLSTDYGWGLALLEENIFFYEATQRYFLSFFLALGSVVFGYAFYKDGILKYRLSDISGIVGIVIALLSLCFMPFFSAFSWIFMFAGFLCLYSVLVPLLSKIYEKMDGNNWERGAVTGLISFGILYFSSYESNILLSKIFAVDPKHFPYTQIIGCVVVLSPWVFVLSIFSLSYFIWKLMRVKKDDSKYSFLFLNGMVASMFLFIFSLVFVGGGTRIIENVAAKVDFNPSSICTGGSEYDGVIYLDPVYSLILIDEKNKKGAHTYTVKECKPVLNKIN